LKLTLGAGRNHHDAVTEWFTVGKAAEFLQRHRRNDALVDGWSFVHLVMGVLGGWLMDPFVALLILVLWEPLEVLILSPLLARIGILFGHESLRNSLSDVAFDGIGVAIGYWLLSNLVEPPFRLF
jgi:hypothetical protein